MARPYIIGLTGGIAAGKSAVSAILKEDYHLPIIDADVLARKVVEPGSEGLAQVAAAFGQGILHADGSLNRGKLGEIIARDEAARQKLNAITHPLVEVLYLVELETLASAGEKLVVYDVPLLLETGMDDAVDEILLVVTPPELRLARLMERDGISRDMAEAKLAMQMSDEEKIPRADAVIVNDGTREQLRSSVAAYMSEKRDILPDL